LRVITVLAVFIGAGCTAVPDPSPVAPVASPDVASVFDGTGGRWIDLTHSFSQASIYWPTDTRGFVHEELAYGVTDGGWFYSSYRFSGAEHGGTHLDAPIHFAEGRLTSDEIPLSNLIGPAAVVDVSDRAHADFLVSIADLTAWEQLRAAITGAGLAIIPNAGHVA